MGEVYRAKQHFLDEGPPRPVAVKLIRPIWLSTAQDEALTRFRAEIRTLVALEHEGIARIYDGGFYTDENTQEELLYIAMQLVPNGKSLTKYAEACSLSVRKRLELFLRVCDAVRYAHERRIVHRDLKPDNILVNGDERPIVIDFGLARAYDALVPGTLRASGTPAYMSPEQVSPAFGSVSEKSDVYALGVILYELLAGHRPYEIPADGSLKQWRQVIAEVTPLPLRHDEKAYGGELESIVMAALAKQPAERLTLDVLRARIKHYIEPLPPGPLPPRPRNQQNLLNMVKEEVTRRLARSLPGAGLINLLKAEHPQQVKSPGHERVTWGDRQGRPLPPETEIVTVFAQEQVAGKLLILGAPGAGKTTMLLHLAQALLTRATSNPDAPIPVLIDLSSWTDDQPPLAHWLVAELENKYGVRPDISQGWLEVGSLVPLLDGLDELAAKRQLLCVRAINAFQQDYGSTKLAVCCRLEEYQNYPEKLELHGAIELLPLTAAQIQLYLEAAGRADLWLLLQEHPDLLALAQSPLLLRLMALALDAHALEILQDADDHPYLFDTYIERMLSQEPTGQDYPREKTVQALDGLATQLPVPAQEFLLEKLQPHINLRQKAREREYTSMLKMIAQQFEVYRTTGLLLSRQALELIAPWQDQLVLPEAQEAFVTESQRHIRRQRIAFWRGMVGVAMTLVLLLLAGVGGWYWDAYHRTHIEYYANVRQRWGLPEGVGRLTDEQVRHRNATLAFVQRGRQGPVHEIRLVNSRGVYPPLYASLGFFFNILNPIQQKNIDGVPEFLATSRVTFERDASGRILTQSGYNRAGRRLYKLHYVQPTVAEYKDGAFAQIVRASGITHIQFVRPEVGPQAGFNTEHQYLDRDGKPQPDDEGVYGYRYIFNQQGLAAESIPLGADGQPTLTRAGVARLTSTYNAMGNVTRIVTLGQDGQPVMLTNGMAEMQMAYDQYGNLTEIAMLGVDGQLVTISALGVAGAARRYDARGNIIELTCFDPNRQLVLGKLGFAKQVVVWDDKGRSTETFFGPDGTPILVSRAVKLKGVWDERGYLVEAAFIDEHDRPTRNEDGCAKMQHVHNEHGNLAEMTCLDEADHPVRSKKGVAKVKSVYDDRGNAVETVYFGPQGQPEYYAERYVKKRAKYNPQGEPVEEVYLDAADHPVKTQEGYAKVTLRYGSHGQPIALAFFDEAGRQTTHKDGYATIILTYGSRDERIEKTYLDPQGQPVRNSDGYAKVRFHYDHRGYPIEEAYFDEHNHPTLHAEGYAKKLMKYNDRGQLLEIAYVGPDGDFVPHQESGAAKVRATYNERGKVSHLAYFDPQDHLIQATYGYATRHYTYDDLGRETTRVFRDIHGMPVHTRVAITHVDPDSNSQRLGLQVGDLILSYEGEDVGNTHVFNDFELVRGERRRELRFQRQNQVLTLTVHPGRLQGLELIDRVPPQPNRAAM
jgi:YD repeat-containing protein